MSAWSDRILTIVVIVLVLLIAVIFCLPHFGWRVDAVLSGSMEPAMHTGGVIISRPVPEQEIRVGDIITFASPQGNGFISHRVTAIETASPLVVHTKGDANEDADP
ncbi:MAG: signal peptidase I, partial [Methanomicrobiales archaeon]|nr:signal peptidase I [Methanomicrobiales archaeon]